MTLKPMTIPGVPMAEPLVIPGEIYQCDDGRFAVVGDDEFRTDDWELAALLSDELFTRGLLNFSPKQNWVDKAGGLPQYIDRIAKHLHDKGYSVSHAVATAVNVVKKACETGDLNYPGIQHENIGSQAEACAAVAEWESLKSKAHATGKK